MSQKTPVLDESAKTADARHLEVLSVEALGQEPRTPRGEGSG